MRCFIALPCAREVVEKLVEVQSKVKVFGGMKLVEPENIHLTLKFLGEVEDSLVGKISSELAFLNEKKKFDVTVKGLGVFPNLNHVNVIWAGVADSSWIASLQKIVDERLGKYFPPDERFHPHYTIARVKYVDDKEGLKNFISSKQDAEFGSYTTDYIKLMASQLTPKGPVYSAISDYKLK
jgi:2'-5' RNA ligase